MFLTNFIWLLCLKVCLNLKVTFTSTPAPIIKLAISSVMNVFELLVNNAFCDSPLSFFHNSMTFDYFCAYSHTDTHASINIVEGRVTYSVFVFVFTPLPNFLWFGSFLLTLRIPPLAVPYPLTFWKVFHEFLIFICNIILDIAFERC